MTLSLVVPFIHSHPSILGCNSCFDSIECVSCTSAEEGMEKADKTYGAGSGLCCQLHFDVFVLLRLFKQGTKGYFQVAGHPFP